MATSFKIPRSPKKSIATIDNFLGVDFTNSPANVDENKSPNAINMIRDVPGKVRKRMGYEVITDYSDTPTRISNYLPTDYKYTYHDKDLHVDIIPQDDGSVRIVGTCSAVYASMNITVLQNKENTIKKGNYKFGVIRIDDSETIMAADAVLNYGERRTFADISYYRQTKNAFVDFTANQEEQISAVLYLGFRKRDGVDVETIDVRFGLMIINPEDYTSDIEYVPYGIYTKTLNVNGIHGRTDMGVKLHHIGTNLYYNGEPIYTSMKDAFSKSWQIGDNVYIIDGKKFVYYDWDDDTIKPVMDSGTIPITTIAKTVDGKADTLNPYNLLNRGFTETFINSYTDEAKQVENKTFQLSVRDLDRDGLIVETLDLYGNWNRRVEEVDYHVERETGTVTFIKNAGVFVPERVNVKITAFRKAGEWATWIDQCNVGIKYGVNGETNRLFLTGCPEFPNRDWYSEINDPTYFPDTNYCVLGSDKSYIMGYSIVSNHLVTYKDDNEMEFSIIIREGTYANDQASFRTVNTLQGEGAISKNAIAYLATEPLFLTESGLYAITAQDITGEKYSQSRSFYLNGKLTKEKSLDLYRAFAVEYNNMYLLAVGNDRMYILDGLQPIRTDKSEPYSTRQYAAFYCDGIPIRYLWKNDDELWFGTSDGRICRFFKDKDDTNSYNDNGQPIICQWETPDIDGNLFYKNKSLRYLAVRVGAAIRTSMKIYAMQRGLWKFVKEDNTFARYFVFDNIDFSKFSFKTDKTQQISRTKLRIKKVDKYRIRLVNDQLNEPFTLYNMAMEYIENGNFKG